MAALTHDDNGNITFDRSKRYYYDVENRLTKVEDENYNVLGEYFYDALGRCIRKVVTNTDWYDGTYYFVWNADWQLMETYVWSDEDGGPMLSHAVVNAGSPTPWYAAMGVQPSALPYVDDHVALIKRNGDYFFYHTDAQFNTLAITDANGSLAATYVESPYGVLESFTVAGGSGLGSLATNNALLHQGLMYDVETGTYYNRWRQYLAYLGRFAQRDPAEYLDGTNQYQYVSGRPIKDVDPSGLQGGDFGTLLKACSATPQGRCLVPGTVSLTLPPIRIELGGSVLKPFYIANILYTIANYRTEFCITSVCGGVDTTVATSSTWSVAVGLSSHTGYNEIVKTALGSTGGMTWSGGTYLSHRVVCPARPGQTARAIITMAVSSVCGSYNEWFLRDLDYRNFGFNYYNESFLGYRCEYSPCRLNSGFGTTATSPTLSPCGCD